ncbi:MAG: UPF0175 family protein [Bacteroidota bacterium]
MKGMITIAYPESLANSLRLSAKDFEYEMKTSAMVKLFELGKVSSGIAAKFLEMKRLDFVELLAKYNVSVFNSYDLDDLSEDIANA